MTENERVELEIQNIINKHVDDFKSFRFNAGAGAGKTYALIETLKYVSISKIASKKSPQKVACVTYTNVAVDEIKRRLGNSEIVHVSTIHERLWDIIKRAQPQLLICHKEKILEVVEQIKQDLLASHKAKFFNDLNEDQKQEFIDFSRRTKDLYYQSKRLSAKCFGATYKEITDIDKPEFLDKCLRNIKNFQYVVSLLYKNERLEECLERIDAGKESRVDYDSRINSDRLHYMKFSHDTLLEYGLKLVETYPIICRIIIDSYPYFFIDEYQDAHVNVVKFVKTLHDYSIKNNKGWMVGYFGDTAQSIYDDGVGKEIVNIHSGLVDIDKIYNRRSHRQIIDVVNKIRADEIVQKPILDERNAGSVRFFYNISGNDLDVTRNFLLEYKNDLIKDIEGSGNAKDQDGRIHCLVLTNKHLASFNGFGDVYDVYSKSVIYYDNLNTQVLSQQLEKLHPTVLSIYRFIKLYQDIKNGRVSYFDIFGGFSKNLTFAKASLVVRELEGKEVETFKDWIDLIISRLRGSDAKEALVKVLINRVNCEESEVVSADEFQSIFIGSINALMNESSEDEGKAKENINSVLALPIASLMRWADFISGIEGGDLSYHTYHGSKGEEYRNVAIILGHSFGSRNKDKFKNYFKFLQESTEKRDQLFSDLGRKENHINTQNLLYVACSRAIKNLRVLYLDDISEIENGIKSIFGDSKPWSIGGVQSSS